MTPGEQKLAARIHKQRVRLRQLENFSMQSYDRWKRWFELALRLGRENKELRSEIEDLRNGKRK